MRASIIGAGRGSRLMPTTAETPKCFAEVAERRILDWTVDALQSGGITEVVFIGGYRIDVVREQYPEFVIRHNDQWEKNNILASLFYAEDLMDEPFVCCYSDVLLSRNIVQQVQQSPADIALGVDTEWLVRYEHRSEHPSDAAEKVIVENGRMTRIHRDIPAPQAHGEFIGLA